MSTPIKSCSLYVGRYFVAACAIPFSVVLGVGGLAQNWSRSLRGRPRRSAPEPVGRPEGSGLERLGDS